MKRVKMVGCLRGITLLGFSFWLLGSFLYGAVFPAPVDFPKKEITIIVNMGPGGGRDILARGVGNVMSKYLGVPVVVINMPGAGGARGLLSLYHAAPDGYTIGIGMGSDIIDQILQKREYDSNRFTYIGNAQHSPGFYFVKSDSPFRSVKDFKTFGKPLRFSTFSLNAMATITSVVIAKREGFPLVIVAGYQSAAAATLGLIRGEVEFSGPGLSTAMPFVQAGQIRPILTYSPNPLPDFPGIQTVREIGQSDLESLAPNYWFMAPPGVPKDRIQILEDALMKTLKNTEFLRWAKGAGVDPYPLSGEETTKMVFKLFGILEQYKGDIEKYIQK